MAATSKENRMNDQANMNAGEQVALSNLVANR